MSKNENTIEHDFKKACDNIKSVNNLDNDTLLSLYGYYKQSVEGDCMTEKPSFFDMKGGAKWNSWFENKGMDKKTAMKRYIRKVNKILEK